MTIQPRAALFLVTIVWGLSPAIVVSFRNAFSPSLAASLCVLIAAVCATTVAFGFDRASLRDLRRIRYLSREFLPVIACSFTGFYLYPICYFHALQSAVPVQANIINYSWPAVALVLTPFFAGKRPSVEAYVAVALGLIGTVILVLPMGSFPPLFGGGGAVASSVAVMKLPAYLAAGLGAVSYGTYTALLSQLKVPMIGDPPASRVTIYLCVLLGGAVLHAMTNIGLLANGGWPDHLPAPGQLLSLLGYATVSLAFGYYLWFTAVWRQKIAVSTVTYYLTPAIGTSLLILFNGRAVEFQMLYGFLFVLIGIYFSRADKSIISPLMVASLATLLAWTAANLNLGGDKGRGADAPGFGLISLLTAIFSILASLTLGRVRDRYVGANKLMLEMEGLLQKIAVSVEADSLVGPEILRSAIFLVNVNAESSLGGGLDRDLDEAARKRFDALEAAIKSPAAPAGTREANAQRVAELAQHFTLWRHSKTDGLLPYEWAVIVGLIGALVFASYGVGGHGLDFEIGRAVFIGTAVLIGFGIRDYSAGCPGRLLDFVDLMQGIFRRFGVSPYVPEAVLDNAVLAARTQQRHHRVYTGADARARVVVGNRFALISTWFVVASALAVAGVVTFRRLTS